MIIEHSEVLRSWLTNALSPICDADPAALAKYVMALLKKDKPEQELKEFCIDQLDVFLQKETKAFVEQLFVVIKDKSYVAPATGGVKQESLLNAASATGSQDFSAHVATTTPIVASSVDVSRQIVKDPTTSAADDFQRSVGGSLSSGRRRSREDWQQSKRSRSPANSRSRSRSRERGRKQASTLDKQATALPLSRQHAASASSSVAATSSGSGARDRDKENRESRHHGRQSSPPKDRKRPTSRERVRHRSRDATPISETASLSTGLLEVSPTEIDKTKVMDKDKKRKRQRCRDYDEKGYCMRGDSCPFDHGPDPVVVEEVSLPRMITIKAPPPPVDFSLPPPGYSVVPPPPGVDHGFSTSTEAYNPEAPSISSSVNAGQQQIQQHGTLSSTSSSYAQLPPSVWNQPPPNYNVQFSNVKPTYRSRELITLAEGEQQPSVMSTVRVVAPVPQSSYGGFRPDKRQLPSSRLQSNAGAPAPYDKTNRTLEVRRIPVSFNTITKLNEHFAQFGHITNIQVRYDDDPEAALVTFASRPQAVAAYKSTAPILNNRFIRMFWHNKDANDDLSTDRPSVKDRLGPAPIDPMTPLDDTSMKARLIDPTEDAEGNRRSVLLTTSGGLTKTVYNPAALKSAAASVYKPNHPVTVPQVPAMEKHVHASKKQQVAKAKEVYKKQLELQKAKADLFTKQVEQQKKLLKQLEKCKQPEKKKEIIMTIKLVEKSIQQLKEGLNEIKLPPASSKSKEQVERQLLDAELEMMNQKQSGTDTTDLNRRLVDLRRQIRQLNELAGACATSTPVQQQQANASGSVGSAHKAGASRTQRRIPSHANLDKRPRDLMVMGFSTNEKELLIEHFGGFGVLEDIEFLHQMKDQPPRAMVVYKLRKDAEQALAKGKEFQDKTLDIQWFNRRTQIPSEKDDSKAELTAQDILATLDDDDDDVSSDDNQVGDIDEEVPDIERGWKR